MELSALVWLAAGSGTDCGELESAVRLGQTDCRDLLMAAGFGWQVESYLQWEPAPFDVAPQIDAMALEARDWSARRSVAQ